MTPGNSSFHSSTLATSSRGVRPRRTRTGSRGIGGDAPATASDQLPVGNPEQRRDSAEDGRARVLGLLQLAGDEREREGRAVVDERNVMAIVEDAPGGRHRPHPHAVLVGRSSW